MKSHQPIELRDNSLYHYSENDGLLDRFDNNLGSDKLLRAFISEKKLSDWRNFEGDVRARIAQAKVCIFDSAGYEHNTDDPFVSVIGYPKDYTLSTGNLVGEVVSNDNKLCVRITSRFGDHFLRYLLMDADGFLPIEGGGVSQSEKGADWMLMFAWAAKLRVAFSMGLPKSYVSERERLSYVRGCLDVVEFALNKTPGKYLCDYRRLSYCNFATLLIARVFGILGENRVDMNPALRAIRQEFVQATEGRKLKDFKLLETKHFTNPLYVRYNPVINLSKCILRRLSGDIGEDIDASSFLFDMSMLFEYYVRKLVSSEFSTIDKNDASFATISRGLNDEGQKLKPDLLFEGDRGLYVFDVKYKYFSTIPGKGGVDRDDLYQLHTYVGRYGNDSHIAGCGFIYPVKEDRWERDFHFASTMGSSKYSNDISQHGKRIPFHVVFIKIPNANVQGGDSGKELEECFREYVDRLKASESDFLMLMKEIAENQD